MFPKPVDILPHRAPFLFVDEVVACTREEIVALKLFSGEEPFFAGHFPGHPIVPGVLLVEAMAQAMAYWSLYMNGESKILLAGVDKARFRKPVLPGDQLKLKVYPGKARLGVLKARAEVYVDDILAAEAKLSGAFAVDLP